MKNPSRRLFPLVFASSLTVALTLTALFSSAQTPAGPPSGLVDNPGLARARIDAWHNKRIPHPACPNCYKVDSGLPGIFERVPGTDKVISRDLPDPAPLELGEIRPAYHPETREPLWYKGRQAFVGPTDEEPVSASLPIPLIEVKRIKYRHEDELFKIEGVHAVGIAESGIFVSILPEKNANKRSIPTSIEGIPVIIRESGVAMKESHWGTWYRPLSVGAQIDSPHTNGGGEGSVGPHISRDLSDDIGYCCQLYSLTSGHVVHYTYQSPSLAWNATITQGSVGTAYGTVAWVFQETPCPPGGYNACYNAAMNDTRIRPDAAAIGHSGADYYPMASPCSGANKPVRRMQSSANSWVHGPTGIIRIPLFSNCSGSSCLKNWGAMSHQPTGGLIGTEVTEFLFDASGTWYKEGPLDNASYNSIGGDSGGLIAWNGQRDLAGLHEATSLDFPYYRAYIRLDYIQSAFYNAGVSFDHYWGTASGKLRPSATAQDNPC